MASRLCLADRRRSCRTGLGFYQRRRPKAGVALAVAAVPLWVQLSLMDECRGRVERALSSLRSDAGRGTRREMQLCAALGVSLTYTKGSGPETKAAWENALQIAERLNNTDYQL